MKLDFDQEGDLPTISQYSTTGIVVGGRNLDIPFLVIGDEIITDHLPSDIRQLKDSHIDYIVSKKVDIVIVGAGATQVFPDASVLIPALTRGVGVEVMETGAACRSYNVLIAENRSIAGLFFPL